MFPLFNDEPSNNKEIAIFNPILIITPNRSTHILHFEFRKPFHIFSTQLLTVINQKLQITPPFDKCVCVCVCACVCVCDKNSLN